METKAARKRLNENLQQLDEVLPAVAAAAAIPAILGSGSVIGGAISAIGDLGGAYMQNRMSRAMQKKTQRRQKRQDLLGKQKSADMAMGVSPTTGVSGRIKINTNPRASVSQLRSTGGTQLGGSSVGKQFAAKY